MSKETPGVRYAEIERESETARVRVVLDLDGGRKATVDTGIGYFDQLLGMLAAAGRIDLGVSAEGDLAVDDRHTVEEVGYCFGRAVRHALGDGLGISGRSSHMSTQEDALVLIALDLSTRPYLSYDLGLTYERVGGLTAECIESFMRSLTLQAGMSLHVKRLDGHNNHNLCEATFKGLGRALYIAANKLEPS